MNNLWNFEANGNSFYLVYYNRLYKPKYAKFKLFSVSYPIRLFQISEDCNYVAIEHIEIIEIQENK